MMKYSCVCLSNLKTHLQINCIWNHEIDNAKMKLSTRKVNKESNTTQNGNICQKFYLNSFPFAE